MATKPAVSPLAPKTTPTLPRIAGVKLAAAASGVRYQDRDDVMLAVLPAGATIAGVLTSPRPRRRRSTGAARTCRAARCGRSSSTPAMPTPSPASGRQGGRGEHARRRAGARLPAQRGVHGLDRRDRQPLDWEKIAAVVPAMIKGGA
jgi:glutamate N-acetyltransferase/amino-acid N-acetyltransferase